MSSLGSLLRSLFTTGKGTLAGLSEADAGPDPIALFGRWFEEAGDAGLYLPESCALATADADGAPSVRMVLLKGYSGDGFRFFTNYESRKGRELDRNPRGALCFHWNVLHRQARVAGPVERLSTAESRAYFATRPRGSRLGAWASDQSREAPDRAALDRRFREAGERFRGEEIPLPPFWGGYRILPRRLEFWQGRANRMHDRLEYVRRADGDWDRRRLYP